jgi:MtN3 and saliva related transmembrane protein
MIFEQIVGTTAGACTAVSLLPQFIKILKEKKAKEISIFYLFVLLAGLGLWIWYGFLRNDLPVIITNIVSAVLNIATLIASVKYKP